MVTTPQKWFKTNVSSCMTKYQLTRTVIVKNRNSLIEGNLFYIKQNTTWNNTSKITVPFRYKLMLISFSRLSAIVTQI